MSGLLSALRFSPMATDCFAAAIDRQQVAPVFETWTWTAVS
jgi:hypothetical protein